MVRILNKTYPQHLGILVKFSRTWTTSCQFWNTLMKSIVDEHAPIKTMRVRGQDVPYMTTKWKNAMRAKWKAEARYRQNKTA